MKFHIVQVGENKEKIAKLYNIEVDDISKLNPTINNRDLIVGEKIKPPTNSNISVIATAFLLPVKTNFSIIKNLLQNICSKDIISNKYSLVNYFL